MRTRAVITGGNGFIGSHLVQRLVQRDWDITVLARNKSNLDPLRHVHDQISIRQFDGSIESLSAIVEQARPDIGIHLAALFLADHEPDQLQPLIQGTFEFGCQFAEALKHSGCRRLLNTGTSWQHDANGNDCPINLYAALKQAFETVLGYYASAHDLRVISLILFDTYGPEDHRGKLFSFLRKAESATERIGMSPGEQLLDLVYIDDVVDAYEMAAAQLLSDAVSEPRRYAVSSSATQTLREIVEIYEQVNQLQLNIEWGGRPYRSREVMTPWQTGELVPNWRPRIDLREGLLRLQQSQFPRHDDHLSALKTPA